jgi:hypothetical protein
LTATAGFALIAAMITSANRYYWFTTTHKGGALVIV